MSNEIQDKAALQNAYQVAVLEFNLATVPLIVAMGAQVLPSDPEVLREENARATVIETRRNVWAVYPRLVRP